jgi:hypothetical protein
MADGSNSRIAPHFFRGAKMKDKRDKRKARVKHPFKKESGKSKREVDAENVELDDGMRKFNDAIQDLIDNPIIPPKKIER